MTTTTAERLDAAFIALADPTRRAIVARLAHGDAAVTELGFMMVAQKEELLGWARRLTACPVQVNAASPELAARHLRAAGGCRAG